MLDDRPAPPRTPPGINQPQGEFPIRRPPFWTLWLVSFLAAVIGGTALALLRTPDEMRFDSSTMVITVSALVLIAIAARFWTRPTQVPSIRFHRDHMTLPRSASSERSASVPLSDILSVDLWGRPPNQTLIISTRGKLYTYPSKVFTDPNASALLKASIYARIRNTPGGGNQMRNMLNRNRLAATLQSRRPVVTHVILVTIVVAYLLELANGAIATEIGLVRLGANAPILVQDGQWFRLVSANFLHANGLHIGLNGLALFALGSLLERWLGWQRFALVYLLSALGGSLASAWAARALFSVGASTALFGLLGSLAVVNWLFRRNLPGGFYQPLRWWAFIIGINVLLPLLMPAIDVAAHAGGFLTGVLVTYFLCTPTRRFDADDPRRWMTISLAIVIGVFAIGLVQAARNLAAPNPEDELRVAREYVLGTAIHPVKLNEFAWKISIDPRSSRSELHLAYQAAVKANAQLPDNSAILDTLATTEYRLGMLDLAIANERLALRLEDSPWFATQLARFLAAEQKRTGPVLFGEATPQDIQLALESKTDGKPRAIVLKMKREFKNGLVIFARIVQGNKPAGLFQAVIGPNHADSYRFEDPKDPDLAQIPDGATITLALIDAAQCPCEPNQAAWRFWPADPDVAELP